MKLLRFFRDYPAPQFNITIDLLDFDTEIYIGSVPVQAVPRIGEGVAIADKHTTAMGVTHIFDGRSEIRVYVRGI